MAEQLWYTGRRVGDRYYALVYKYDKTGNKEITVWKSSESFLDKGEAEDRAIQWLEEQELEASLD